MRGKIRRFSGTMATPLAMIFLVGLVSMRSPLSFTDPRLTLHTQDGFQGSRFARSVASQQADQFPGIHLKIDIIQHLDVAVVGVYIVKFKYGHIGHGELPKKLIFACAKKIRNINKQITNKYQ